MSALPGHLSYTTDHEWVMTRPDGTVAVGITDHAQHQLGELVYVELPEPERSLKKGEACAVVESVKAASDVYAPLDGTVTEVNPALATEPALVNNAPYGEGWLFRMKPGAGALDGLLDATAYQRLLDAEG